MTSLFYSLKMSGCWLLIFVFPPVVVLNKLLEHKIGFYMCKQAIYRTAVGVCARGGGQQKEASSAPFYHNCNYHIAFLKEINDVAPDYLPPHTLGPSLTYTY